MFKFSLITTIIVTVAAISLLGFYIARDLQKNIIGVEKGEENIPITQPFPLTKGEGAPFGADRGLEQGTIKKQSLSTPDLNRPIAVKANLPEETKKEAFQKIGEMIKNLKENPDLFSSWIDLGSYAKLLGDNDGALMYWQYASAIRPASFLPLANLGDLYLHNLRDIKKAEANYLAALKNGPDQIMVYEKLSDLYRYFLNDPTRAKAILQEGISKNPVASDRLKYLLTSF